MLLNYRVLIVGTPGESQRALAQMAKRLGCQVIDSNGENLAQFFNRQLAVDLLLFEGRADFRPMAQRVRAEHLAPLLFYQAEDKAPGEKWGLQFLDNKAEDSKWKSAMAIAVEKYDRKEDFRDSKDQLNSAGATRMMVAKAQSCLVQEDGGSDMQNIYLMQVLSQKMGISLRQMAQRVFLSGMLSEETA